MRRLMGIMGLQAVDKGPNTGKKHPEHRMYPYLLRKLPITQPNHAAQSGLVQRHHLHPSQQRLSVSGGDHGLGDAQTVDLAALKYAGARFCVEALEKAISKYGKPESMNTDQGSQYTGSG